MLHSQGRPEAGRHVKEQWLAEPNSSVTGRGAPLSPQVGKVETFGHQYAFARAPVWWRGEVWTGREERGDTIIYLIRPACDPALRCQAIDSSPSSLPRSPLTASLPLPGKSLCRGATKSEIGPGGRRREKGKGGRRGKEGGKEDALRKNSGLTGLNRRCT